VNPRSDVDEREASFPKMEFVEVDGITRRHFDPESSDRIRKEWSELPDYLWKIEQAKPIHYRGHLEDSGPEEQNLRNANPTVMRVDRYIAQRQRFTKNKDYFVPEDTEKRYLEEGEVTEL